MVATTILSSTIITVFMARSLRQYPSLSLASLCQKVKYFGQVADVAEPDLPISRQSWDICGQESAQSEPMYRKILQRSTDIVSASTLKHLPFLMHRSNSLSKAFINVHRRGLQAPSYMRSASVRRNRICRATGIVPVRFRVDHSRIPSDGGWHCRGFG